MKPHRASRGALRRRLVRVALLLTALSALTASTASAHAVARPHLGKLPGFPAVRGVVPVLGSPQAVSAHEQLVGEAFASARRAARLRHAGPAAWPRRSLDALRSHAYGVSRPRAAGGAPVANEELEPCATEIEEELTYFTQDVCYHGGPVLHDPTIHLIFWQGTGQPHVAPFTASYEETVEGYFEAVAYDSGLTSDTFSVDSQYWEEQNRNAFREGEYRLSFNRLQDVTIDTATPLPEGHCSDVTSFCEGPCLLDSDIQKEAETVAGPTPKGLGDIYVVLTPRGVGGCFEAQSGECAYEAYCAYHSDFGGNGMSPGDQTLYADLPYLGDVPGCDSGIHPNETVTAQEEKEGEDHGADAVIDTASHEINETITDPIGSQCDEEEVAGEPEIVGCEPNGWLDAIGQEIADKCLPPESTLFGIYGEPLGQLFSTRPTSLFNQEIDGRHYWTQRVWSNEAGLFEGACVQRTIGASFTAPSAIEATVPATLDASASGASGDPATYWAWNFGEGEQIGTASPTLSHTFAREGTYVVGLTAFDAYGNSRAVLEEVDVGAPPVPPTPSSPPTVTTTVTVTVPAAPAPPVKITKPKPKPSTKHKKCPSSSHSASKGCPATRRPGATRTPHRRCGSPATSRRTRRCPRSKRRSSARSPR